jgi:hypothetical protein
MALGDKSFDEVTTLNAIVAILQGTTANSNIADPTGILKDLVLTSAVYTTETGTITAGKSSVMFTCISGVEIVNGVTRAAGQVIVYEWYNKRTPNITYDANSGSLQIDILE